MCERAVPNRRRPNWWPVTHGELRRRLQELWDYVLEQENAVSTLGEKLSAVSDMVAALDAATNEVASDLAALRDQVANLDPAVAAQFQPILDRLTALGADPQNPVPPVEEPSA